MIYLDTSVVLAELFAEERRPAEWMWAEELVSSRLLEYEMWTPDHARGAADTHRAAVEGILRRVGMLELNPVVLGRALESFPVPVRTFDAMHLASVHFSAPGASRCGLPRTTSVCPRPPRRSG
jgi:hypothetical protein